MVFKDVDNQRIKAIIHKTKLPSTMAKRITKTTVIERRPHTADILITSL